MDTSTRCSNKFMESKIIQNLQNKNVLTRETGKAKGEVFSLKNPKSIQFPSYIQNSKAKSWIEEMVRLCSPDRVHFCEGSEEEYQKICNQLVESKTFVRLNPKKRPNSFAAFSDPSDVARVEDRTFIASEKREDAGPTNNWVDPKEMKKTLNDLFLNSMQGRTMYVIPFSMGPLGSP